MVSDPPGKGELAFKLTTYLVDICITTPWKELEGVCMIAELLAKRKRPSPTLQQSSAFLPIRRRRYGKSCLYLRRQGSDCQDMGS
jgi:hypothetical protein